MGIAINTPTDISKQDPVQSIRNGARPFTVLEIFQPNNPSTLLAEDTPEPIGTSDTCIRDLYRAHRHAIAMFFLQRLRPLPETCICA